MTRALCLVACLLGACDERSAPADPARSSQGSSGSAGDEGLSTIPKVDNPHFRELLAAIAEARACTQIRNSYHGLRSASDPNEVTGELWVRSCNITSHGTELQFHFGGDGWQRVDRDTKKLGATFAVHEYVRFHVDATLDGTIDLAYAPDAKVATVWFKPKSPPQVKFEPIGEVEVDQPGLWSQIIGTIATVIGKAPEKEAEKQVKEQGSESFVSRLDKGMTITVNACTGSTRSQFGLLPPGKEPPLDVGDTMTVKVTLYHGGLLIFGPEFATRHLAIDARASSGPVHVQVACAKEADKVAKAYVAREALPEIKNIKVADVHGHETIDIAKPSCPFAVIAQSDAGAVSLRWKREPPPGAALIDCPPEQANPETARHARPTPQNVPSTPGPPATRSAPAPRPRSP